MSISIDPKDGVRFSTARKRGFAAIAGIIALEAIFSFFLYISIAQKLFAPMPAESAAGVPELISYQGLLTNTSGTPLGGTGTVYCFRYAIYDAATAGNQLWPAGTPTNSTTTVVSGVFGDQLGRMDNLSSLNFTATSTYYLQVQVNTTTSTCSGSWENLTPRQQITSDAWSQTAQSVYGPALWIGTSTKVQIGSGGGVSSSSVTLLSLDNANGIGGADQIGGSCTNNGSLWYDSQLTRALVCENNLIWPISNGSTTIAGIGTNASASIMAGSVVFSNANNVSFGQNGSTITASADAGGGATLNYYNPQDAYILVTGAVNQGTLKMQPMAAPDFQYDRIAVPIYWSNSSNSTGTATLSIWFGIYTRNISTLSLGTSFSTSVSVPFSGNASSASYNGIRLITIGYTDTVTQGVYYVGEIMSSATAGGNGSFSQLVASQQNSNFSGLFGTITNGTIQQTRGLGFYSAATNAMPASIGFNQLNGSNSSALRQPSFYFVSGTF